MCDSGRIEGEALEAALRAFVLKEAEDAGWDEPDESLLAERELLWQREVRAAITAYLAALGGVGPAATDGAGTERNHWIRLFNRLDAAVSRHRTSSEAKGASILGPTEDDEALWDAHDKILNAAAGAHRAPTGDQTEGDDG